jgi:hypothetical protein
VKAQRLVGQVRGVLAERVGLPPGRPQKTSRSESARTPHSAPSSQAIQ